ncbi:MAG: hypothetical protein NC338_06150 [Firmicutes bacterium]|nr:hypothetical protein [Bacillota bacterium]MCM1400575.1 hypothetical protein [Bacteroides sp.]MCM1476479.1 hypothetical protein [Bacteroides sp.]
MPPTPKWMIAVIVIVLLPVFQFPMLLASAPDTDIVRTLLWIYPFYCLVAAYLAWQCYPQRHAMAWILLGLMVMSHISMWLLVTTPLT